MHSSPSAKKCISARIFLFLLAEKEILSLYLHSPFEKGRAPQEGCETLL